MYPQIANNNSDSQWDLIALGLEEPLPSQDVIDELYVLYAALYFNMCLIQITFQGQYILRKDLPNDADHPSPPVLRKSEPRPSHAAAYMSALHYVVSCCICQ
jgi:hypothetical protein